MTTKSRQISKGLILRGYFGDKNVIWNGFVLQKGFWYGENEVTHQNIVTSDWENNGDVAMYIRQKNGEWIMQWIPCGLEICINLEGIPKFDKNKKTLREWLEENCGIAWQDYEEKYSGIMLYELQDNYFKYYYDNLSKFVYLRIDKNTLFCRLPLEKKWIVECALLNDNQLSGKEPYDIHLTDNLIGDYVVAENETEAITLAIDYIVRNIKDHDIKVDFERKEVTVTDCLGIKHAYVGFKAKEKETVIAKETVTTPIIPFYNYKK